MLSRIVGLTLIAIVCVAGGAFTWMGLRLAFEQGRRLGTFQIASATILSSRLELATYPGEGGAQDRQESKPVIEYEFQVGSRRIVGAGVDPEQVSGSAEWANPILARFPRGAVVDAYYDPERPEVSYLVHGFETTGYALALVGIFALSLWGALWRETAMHPVDRVTRVDNGHQVMPSLTVRGEILTHVAVIGVGALAWGVTAGHYLLVAPRPLDVGQLLWGAVLPLVGAYSARSLFRLLARARRYGQARVLIDAETLKVGEDFDVRIEQEVREEVRLRGVAVTLFNGRFRKSLRGAPHATQFEPIDRLVRAGETLSLRLRLQVEPSAQPTNAGLTKKPESRWWIEVNTVPENGADWFGRFPVRMESPGF